MGGNAAFHTVLNSVQALGRGFDVNFDTRLLYCKGLAGSRIVEVDEEHTRDLLPCDGIVVPNVSREIKSSREMVGRGSSGILTYQEMVEYFNKKADLPGNVPLGSFNSAFSFTGLKKTDAAATKSLSVDGFFVPLCKVQLIKYPSVLEENVKQAIPSSWDPSALASFIENFGTHVITSVTIGGKDAADPCLFNNQGIYPQPNSAAPYLYGKEDVTVIFRRRGGDDLVQSHIQWVETIRNSPDVIEMTFFPITALLDGIPCKDHLSRAISLYLEYKPPIEELRYFLEFQIPQVWAPVVDKFLGHQRKEPVCPSLQFSIMGQKLYVSQEQVSVGRKPVTGLRLYLEGAKQNRLSIQLQHLACLPKILRPYWDTHVAIGAPKWQGSEEQDSRWFEPVKWKNFSHVSTAPIENNETFIGDLSGVYIVTGAQLGVWDFGSKNVLHMKLLYSRLPGCTIRRSFWDHTPSFHNGKSKKLVVNEGSTNPENSSSGSKDGVTNKLAKLVDMSEMSKGPLDTPGHWLVTGGKLGVDKGRVVLRVKYSLLNY
ncbi:hypothetical protein IFM89_021168 [Coptis chinensis]|uniref:MACPF domain-containing protein n=1 Tax=Coptis chinensis TaxID=261450 RepID=A0A835HEJ6_9MAGN|nr:hypothetical protein IFM89_021168 [Coptis chinensis]